ncbi:MAG: hypothetical protein SVO01_01790 [Thermotogota bacterium]|nr:hypothetical protein [Thermotogota bacterium]
MSKSDPMKLVLSVVDPDYPNDSSVKELVNDNGLFKSATKLAEKNGLYYYFIYRLKELGVEIPSSEDDRWNEEIEKLSYLKETITLLNEASKECGLNYVLIKACTKIPHVPRDVDIFIRDKDQRAFVGALEGKGMKCIHSDDVDTTLTKGDYMKVDIYTGLCYFTTEFIDEGFLWKSQHADKMFDIDYPGLNEEANFLVMLVHSLFGHSSMSLLDFLHMKSLIGGIRDMDVCRNYAYEMGWGSAFDLTMDRMESINISTYKEGENIDFPYMFDQKFILKCISDIDGLDMTNLNKIFLRISLIQDRAIFELKDTPLYNLLKSIEPIRKFINTVGYYIRDRRGDKRSEG